MKIRKADQLRLALALALPTLTLSGCYVMPGGAPNDSAPVYAYARLPPVAPAVHAAPPAPAVQPGGPMAASLPVKLHPSNELAHPTGVLTGEVTNTMTGKCRFAFQYQVETL